LILLFLIIWVNKFNKFKNFFSAILNGKCLDKTPLGYYKYLQTDFRGLSYKMVSCKNNCLSCHENTGECDKCNQSYTLIHGECVLDCEKK
jgi:hypothetical protein